MRLLKVRGMTALELLVAQEHATVPGVKVKTFVSKYAHMKLNDYSADPGEAFWSKVNVVT